MLFVNRHYPQAWSVTETNLCHFNGVSQSVISRLGTNTRRLEMWRTDKSSKVCKPRTDHLHSILPSCTLSVIFWSICLKPCLITKHHMDPLCLSQSPSVMCPCPPQPHPTMFPCKRKFLERYAGMEACRYLHLVHANYSQDHSMWWWHAAVSF